MTLGRVVGSIVATRKDPRLQAHTLLVVKPVTPDARDEPGYHAAAVTLRTSSTVIADPYRDNRESGAFILIDETSNDTVGAGTGQLVFTVGGSSARMAYGCQDKPVDCVIVGIVDGLAMDESKAGK